MTLNRYAECCYAVCWITNVIMEMSDINGATPISIVTLSIMTLNIECSYAECRYVVCWITNVIMEMSDINGASPISIVTQGIITLTMYNTQRRFYWVLCCLLNYKCHYGNVWYKWCNANQWGNTQHNDTQDEQH
jgi:hypothetical protein